MNLLNTFKPKLFLLKEIFSICILILIINLNTLVGQNNNLNKFEDSLKYLNSLIAKSDKEIDKKTINDKFKQTLLNALNSANSFDYPFDSLKTISKLISSDNRLRIFTWTIINEDGKYFYYGIIQIRSGNNSKSFILVDKSDSLRNPENLILPCNKWYGAVYYKIILNKYKKQNYYTLLGWQGNNLSTRKKIIDVITINKENTVTFGSPIFKTEKSEPNRIIFEYSSDAVMSLKYEQQYYNKIKGQNIFAYERVNKKSNISSNKNMKKHKKIKAYMIVFDRLVSLTPIYKDQYQFYVPTTDYVDGFLFRAGKWRLIYDIDARNPKR